jgi:hypothetical protein
MQDFRLRNGQRVPSRGLLMVLIRVPCVPRWRSACRVWMDCDVTERPDSCKDLRARWRRIIRKASRKSLHTGRTSKQSRGLVEKLIVAQLVKSLPALYFDPKVHYRVENSPPLNFALSSLNTIHAFPSHFFKISYNIILISVHGSFKWSGLFRISA